jgi:hypothetical protein
LFFLFLFCLCVRKGKPLLCALGNCSNKDHATCKWDQLWIDGLWIKLTLIFRLARVASSKLLILLNIQCGVHPFNVMPKFKRDENFANLIWANKVFYARALKMFRIAKMEWDLHLKESWKGDHLICELPWIGDDSWSISAIIFNFHFKFALCFKHVFSKLYSLLCVYFQFWIRSITKKAFIVNLVKIILANWQLYTWQYFQFAQTIMTHYHSANGLSLKSINEILSDSEGEQN